MGSTISESKRTLKGLVNSREKTGRTSSKVCHDGCGLMFGTLWYLV